MGGYAKTVIAAAVSGFVGAALCYGLLTLWQDHRTLQQVVGVLQQAAAAQGAPTVPTVPPASK